MAGAEQFIGGLAQGFVGSKQKAQEQAMMQEYKKAQLDMLKLEAKAKEQAFNLQTMEQQLQAPIYQAIAQALAQEGQGGGMMQPPMTQAPQPQAQPGIPEMVAQGQNPLLNPTGGQAPPMGGSITIPGDPANNISVRQNNPGNLKYVGQEGALGAGTRGFAIFPTAEAGFAALQKQIELDKSRGLTLSQFAHKYAPSFENDTNNWIKVVANYTGATPDTPLAAIPTPLLAQGVAKIESSASFGPGMGTPQQAMQPRPAQARQPLLTGQKLLEGFLKKKFGIEPDDAKVVPYGDHKLVTDKQGNPKFLIAGQGKTEMVDIKQPDGSVIRTPQLIPPSPLPGGIPVVNMAGQPVSGMATPEGLQTAPPEYDYQEVKSPTGATTKIAVPKAQPGISFESEPAGMKLGDVGKANLIARANERLNEVNDLIFPGGKLDRTILLKAQAPGGGIGDGAKLYSKLYQTIDAALRLETGAQATPGEISVKMQEFWPRPHDTESVIRSKNKDLNLYLKGLQKLHDPTGQIGKMGEQPKTKKTDPLGLR